METTLQLVPDRRDDESTDLTSAAGPGSFGHMPGGLRFTVPSRRARRRTRRRVRARERARALRGDGETNRWERLLAEERGAVTAEYAIVIMAAVAFAGLLVAILRSSEIRAMLMQLVENALGAAG